MTLTFIHDLSLERLILGTLIHHAPTYAELSARLRAEYFYDTFHARLYALICQLYERGQQPDVVSLRAELKRLDTPFELSRLMAVMEENALSGIEHHVLRLTDLAHRRHLTALGHYLVKQSGTEELPLEELVRHSSERLLGALGAADGAQIHSLGDALGSLYDIMHRNAAHTDGMLSGSPTGFAHLDRHMGGLQSSDLVIIAAESSQGKTSLACAMMYAAACAGQAVAMYSLEMKKEQMAARLLAMHTGMSAGELLFGRLTQGQMQRVDTAVAALEGLGIYFDDKSTMSLDAIIASIRRLKARHDVAGVVVDYLQILALPHSRGQNKEQQMAEAARRLKNLAKELDIWIIALSQLSRERDNPQPTLGRLRDSGQIAEAADVVLLIYRPEVYGRAYTGDLREVSVRGTALITMAKGRHTGTTRFVCGFEAETTRFYDLSRLPTGGRLPTPDRLR